MQNIDKTGRHSFLAVNANLTTRVDATKMLSFDSLDILNTFQNKEGFLADAFSNVIYIQSTERKSAKKG